MLAFLQSHPPSKCKGCVLYVIYLLYYTVVLVFSVFSSSGLETVFLAFVADKNQLFFGRGAWVGKILSSASFATGSESTEILQEELN